jgi:hypothetical protein
VQLKTPYTLFYIAVLMFVAKPFIGFSLGNLNSESIEVHSLLLKSFSKRKPDDLSDAETRAAAIHQQLINPPLTLLLSITVLLGFLFPVLFKRSIFTGNSFLNNLKLALIPADQPYLLTGKLSI